MPFDQFQRNYYRGGGSGFGGNAWVSLMGGAAQGLLSAQKNRAELIKQAQEEALKRAAEQRAIDASQRERERLEMARKAQNEASKERMKAEEERMRAQRKAREEEAAIRSRSQRWLEQARANPEMTEYYTDAELESLAPRVAAGEINPPRPPKPKEGSNDIKWVNPGAEYKKVAGAEVVDNFLKEVVGVNNYTPPAEGEMGPIRIPPASNSNIVADPETGRLEPKHSSPERAIAQELIPRLLQTIEEMTQILSTAPAGSQQAYQARSLLDQANAALAEARRRLSGTSGDFANQGFDYSGVNTSPGR